jgi:hypothetical protein
MLRYGFLYGPHTWFAKDGSSAEQGRSKQFPIVEDGQAVWSWVHVEDAARAAILAITQGHPGAYNIVDDDPSQLSVWLSAYARWLDAPAPARLSAHEVNGEDAIYNATRLRGASNAKAKRELGFLPRPLEWIGTRQKLGALLRRIGLCHCLSPLHRNAVPAFPTSRLCSRSTLRVLTSVLSAVQDPIAHEQGVAYGGMRSSATRE